MPGHKKIIKQRAQSPGWFYLIIAIAISGFALPFIPFAYENQLIWFIALTIGTFLTASVTLGIRSWISMDSSGKYYLCIYDNSSNLTSFYDFDAITQAEMIEYSNLTNNTHPDYHQHDYHITKNVFAYRGPGLLVCYDPPSKSMGGDGIKRSVQFPAPEAEQLLDFIRENSRLAD